MTRLRRRRGPRNHNLQMPRAATVDFLPAATIGDRCGVRLDPAGFVVQNRRSTISAYTGYFSHAMVSRLRLHSRRDAIHHGGLCGTQFVLRSGELTGTYHVVEADGGYAGTLTDFTPSGACAGRFLWHDRNGTGVVQVNFRPDRDRFDGYWGDEAPLLGQIFTGHRYRPVPLS
jgi:hypothetical protein